MSPCARARRAKNAVGLRSSAAPAPSHGSAPPRRGGIGSIAGSGFTRAAERAAATQARRPRSRAEQREHADVEAQRRDRRGERDRERGGRRASTTPGTCSSSGPTRDVAHVAEEHVQREPDREIQHHADDRRRDRRRARRAARGSPRSALDVRRAEEDPQEARHEGDPES